MDTSRAGRGRVGPYVAAVTVTGAAALAAALVRGGAAGFRQQPVLLALLSVFVLLGELRPIRLPRRDEQEEILTSTTWTYAIVLSCGVAPAMAVRAVVSIIPALLRRKPLWKAGFNAAQYALSLGAAWAVLHSLTGIPHLGSATHFRTGEMPALLLAAAAYFLVNNCITGAALALAQDSPVLAYLRHDLAFQATTAGVLLALSPIVVVCAERSLWFVPLAALPMAAVYGSATVSVEKHQALHDALTNLPNRRLFRDRTQQAVAAAKRSQAPAAVMILDLDRFKEVNDTLGPHVGDLLLQQVASRLQTSLREGDTIARLGGDEFAILLPSVADVPAAEQVAQKIVRLLDEPFVIKGWTFDIDASIGIALYPDHGGDVESLMQRADVAMYLAKESRAGFEVYSADRDRHSPRRLSLLSDLRRALDDDMLVLHYQPKADMRTGSIRGVEALLRWNHPEHGPIPPDEFIPLAEHTGLIRPLTLFVLEHALAQLADWQSQGIDLGVAVNLSVRNLHDPSFADDVDKLLHDYGVPASLVEFEITESVIMADPMRAMAILTRLSDLGVGLSLDDFGVGYSSLAHLKRLPVTEIKIDKSFVMNIVSDESDALIVRSTISLGRSLGLRVVAEGVETPEAWARLVALGCDVAQGFYLCRPKPALEITEWLGAIGADVTHDDPGLPELSGAPSVEEFARRLSASPLPSS
jgi:diguanylate cyclase (GGDEF)-like protein